MPETRDGKIDYSDSLFCYDLPSKPIPEIGKILVTGGTGYIGGRLIPELVARGYDIRVMVRIASSEQMGKWPGTEIVESDGLDIVKLKKAMEGIHTIYYLIHSLLIGQHKYESTDLETADNFCKVAEAKGVKRIICLAGLGDSTASNSLFLKNRLKVAEKFRNSKVPATILHIPIIIGSGSAAFEIIENVVKKVPVISIPNWAETKCQPIAIRDLIKYLVGVLEISETAGKSFDIGSSDILTIEVMMKIMAKLTGKTRFFIKMPVSSFSLYSYLASFITPVPASIMRCVIGGCKYNSLCKSNEIKEYLSFPLLSYEEMILRALSRHECDRVDTRWSDAYPPAHSLSLKFGDLDEIPQYTSEYSILTEKNSESLFKTICGIGGEKGWFNSNWLWRIRGWFDRVLMGVGTSRGRKSSSELFVNDVVDFWRVEKFEQNSLLLLRAEMKLPGMGWLEFKIEPAGDFKNRLSVKAYYTTDTIFGKIYWYLFLPSHAYIFNDMIKGIEKMS